MNELGIGLIGSGFMGKAHTIAYRALPAVFPEAGAVHLAVLADADEENARAAGQRLGFTRCSGDWPTLVTDPAVDIVDVCSPNHLHKPMALAAIEAGKHVYCEKPLALTAVDAEAMADAAEAAGVVTLVGFNYAKNPATALVREIIASGEIGDVVHFRGTHNEDYLADPAAPFNWRCDRALSGSGALGDVGAHILHLARYLVGSVVEVCADLRTVVRERPLPEDRTRTRSVENDDEAACLMRFAGGASGVVETSRVAVGRKMGLTYEITGTRGAIAFDQERMSEIRLYTGSDPRGRQGYRTILLGPDHPDYGAFSPAPGHGLGFNDQKIVEARDLVTAVREGTSAAPDFREASRVSRLIEAIEHSAAERAWQALPAV
ncbi:Gfo/Idh/MocA family protein [Arhodomonas sp. AD133]|uniref:Gfo/Idh/MocA family protein n=1 Tax=Arhodomonas sp. AD133 TaxID=3415009 RepID=UPI003EB76E97